MRNRRAAPPPAAAAVAKVGFDTIEKLQEWLQSQLGADASVGAALSHAFEVQARNSVGPYKLATAPFVPPAALLAFLDTLPEHLRQQQQVGCAHTERMSVDHAGSTQHTHHPCSATTLQH